MSLFVHDYDNCISRDTCEHRSALTKVANCIQGAMSIEEAREIYGLTVTIKCGWFRPATGTKRIM